MYEWQKWGLFEGSLDVSMCINGAVSFLHNAILTKMYSRILFFYSYIWSQMFFFYSVISAGWLFTHIVHLNVCLECKCTHLGVFLLCIMCEVYFPFIILYLMVPGIWTHWSSDVGGQPWIWVNSLGTVSLLIEITWHTFILNGATCTETLISRKNLLLLLRLTYYYYLDSKIPRLHQSNKRVALAMFPVLLQ